MNDNILYYYRVERVPAKVPDFCYINCTPPHKYEADTIYYWNQAVGREDNASTELKNELR